jgi:hypothetical protein
MVFSSHQSCFSFQETNEFMGTVVNVYSSGASDLLHVKLDSSVNTLPKTGKLRTTETRVSDQLIWVPFVEAIVPYVDMNRREMQITPPKGFLELNLRFDERSKKERRQLVRLTLLYSTIDLLNICYHVLFSFLLYFGLSHICHNHIVPESFLSMETQKKKKIEEGKQVKEAAGLW